MKSILIYTDTPFINPWTKTGMIGKEPVNVPYDNLCRAYLRDGSLKRYVFKRQASAKNTQGSGLKSKIQNLKSKIKE